MTDSELQVLENIRLEVISQLIKKWGADKVVRVNDLGEEITVRIINGEIIKGLEDWVYEIVSDFREMIEDHPRIDITVH